MNRRDGIHAHNEQTVWDQRIKISLFLSHKTTLKQHTQEVCDSFSVDRKLPLRHPGQKLFSFWVWLVARSRNLATPHSSHYVTIVRETMRETTRKLCLRTTRQQAKAAGGCKPWRQEAGAQLQFVRGLAKLGFPRQAWLKLKQIAAVPKFKQAERRKNFR